MSIIAFVTGPIPVRSILSYLDLPTFTTRRRRPRTPQRDMLKKQGGGELGPYGDG